MAERRIIRRELAKWSKNILYLVGFEQVAEQLMGPDKFSKMTSTLSYLPPPSSSTAAEASADSDNTSPVSLVSNYTPPNGLSLDEPLDLSVKKVSCVSSINENEPSSHSLLKKLINGSSSCCSSSSSTSSSSPSANVTQSCQFSSPCDHSTVATLKTHLPPPAISASDGLSSSPSLRQPQESTNVDDSSTATSNSTSNDASNDVTAQIASLTPRRSRESTWKRTYTQEALDRALDDIVSGNLGTRRAAVIYGIPRSTLRNKVYKLDNQRGAFGPGRLPGRRPKNATTTGSATVNASSTSTSTSTSTGSTTLLAKRSTSNGNLHANSTAVTNTGGNDSNNNSLNVVPQHNSDAYLSPSPTGSPPISLRNGLSRKPPSPKKSIVNCLQGTSPANPESNFTLPNGSNLESSLFLPNLNGALDANASINPLFMNPLFLAFLMNDSWAMALATQSLQQQQLQQQQQQQQQQLSSGNSPLNRDIYDGNLNTSQSSLLASNCIQEYLQRLCGVGGGGGNGLSSGVASNGMDVDINHTSGTDSMFGHGLYSTESDETGSVSSEPMAPSNHKRRNTGSSTPNLENALRGRTVNRSSFPSSLASGRLERTCLPEMGDDLCESNIAAAGGVGSGNDTSLSGAGGIVFNSSLSHHPFSQLPASTASLCSSVGTAGDTTSTSSSPSTGNGAFSNTSSNTAKIRPKRGRYRNYEREALDKAVAAVRSGEMTVHRAGTYFGVPHSTLEYKVKQRHLLRTSDSSEREKERERDKEKERERDVSKEKEVESKAPLSLSTA